MIPRTLDLDPVVREHDHPAVAPSIHTRAAIEGLRRAAELAWQSLESARRAGIAGATTAQVCEAAEQTLSRAGAASLFKGYRQGDSPPYPAAAGVSVNEQVVHGIPGARRLDPGDLVSVDVGIRLDGWCADVASSFVVAGAPAMHSGRDRLHDLVTTTRWLLSQAIGLMRPGVSWSVIAEMMERLAEASGFGIVTEYVGHGIGRSLHEPPKAPAYRSGFSGADFTLMPGMVLAIEPILTLGRGRPWGAGPDASPPGGLPRWRAPIRLLDDGWTVVTADGLPASHEERMVHITQERAEVLGAQRGGDLGSFS